MEPLVAVDFELELLPVHGRGPQTLKRKCTTSPSRTT
jgi:hypothetical protein